MEERLCLSPPPLFKEGCSNFTKMASFTTLFKPLGLPGQVSDIAVLKRMPFLFEVEADRRLRSVWIGPSALIHLVKDMLGHPNIKITALFTRA